jgi:hypothetical protein
VASGIYDGFIKGAFVPWRGLFDINQPLCLLGGEREHAKTFNQREKCHSSELFGGLIRIPCAAMLAVAIHAGPIAD